MEPKVMSGVMLKDEERQRCEIWTRVMGYHRPVSEFNKGKKGEYYERRFYAEPEPTVFRECRGAACATE